jgi:NTP pyrophosphatase (non-canonical NTP hydrolase)
MDHSNEDISPYTQEQFARHFNYVQIAIHNLSDRNGFWPPVKSERNFGEAIALAHSELSEALEAHRKGASMDIEHNIDHPQVALEFADVIIRLMDLAQGLGLDIASALLAKHSYNRSRSFRHGKLY